MEMDHVKNFKVLLHCVHSKVRASTYFCQEKDFYPMVFDVWSSLDPIVKKYRVHTISCDKPLPYLTQHENLLLRRMVRANLEEQMSPFPIISFGPQVLEVTELRYD